MVYVFHHNDIDGYGSAALIRRAFPSVEIRFVCCDYSEPLTASLLELSFGDTAYFVDYSFDAAAYHDLDAIVSKLGADHVVWIDHHKSSVDLVSSHPELHSLKGVIDMRYSGMALVWMYLNGGVYNDDRFDHCPLAVKLISDYDTWTKSYPQTDAFNSGMVCQDISVDSVTWDRLLVDNDFMDRIVSDGKAINTYRTNYYARKLNKYGFETVFEGHRCLAINQKDNAEIFADKRAMYPLCVIFQTDGKRWYYTVYSSDPHIDCSLIAARYGGGGHKGAAGFVTKELLDVFKCR